MGFGIEDERTRAEKIAPPTDQVHEDVSLLVLRGPDIGQRFLVKPPGGVMGRQPDCVIKIRDPNISRRHALIEFTNDGRVMLTDLGSRNGVFINGVRVSRAEVFDGNNVQVSNDTVMRVRFQDPLETELLIELQGAIVTDKITGLPNRRYLLDRLAQEMSFARRHNEPVAVVMVDVDDFKKVNDTDGQAGGDALLSGIAKLIRRSARLEDVVARYGGDQFVVVLRRSNADAASTFVERLLKAVRKATFDVGDVPIRASVSAGLASFAPEPDTRRAAAGRSKKRGAKKVEVVPSALEEGQRLLDRADAAMYEAKSGGKDRFARWKDGEPAVPTE